MPAGRPPFQPTDEQRRLVSIARGGQMTKVQIARGIGIDVETLNKYFGHELTTGVYERRLEVLKAMHEQALAGNVAAQKAYLAFQPEYEPPAPKQDEPEVGKKEQRDRDARTAAAGTEWGDLLPPHEARTLQ